jgi:hypothetical protein
MELLGGAAANLTGEGPVYYGLRLGWAVSPTAQRSADFVHHKIFLRKRRHGDEDVIPVSVPVAGGRIRCTSAVLHGMIGLGARPF